MKSLFLLTFLIINSFLVYAGIPEVPQCAKNVKGPSAHRGNGYYIGFTWNNCKSDHVYICTGYTGICGDNQQCNAKGCFCTCTPVYTECYDYKGNYSMMQDTRKGFDNPFTSKSCGTKRINAIANANDSNCYYSAYGNKVLLRNMKKRTVGAFTNNDGSLRTINGRCLIGGGWCPCRKA
ncbi:hypothetical protein H8356DRAFT_1753445 [Neocallimastix lanati (nom. inval.)]|nr:hypothetical protein H8356DRAFT_1755946 [Neocallimastix sp. JGI-2020a]KAG4082442.1 hypothetical protein H8356DRAFT_1753445 [Neocallimastix sp. JGI-2020a]